MAFTLHESIKIEILLCVFEIAIPFLMVGFVQKDFKNDKCPNLSWRRDNLEKNVYPSQLISTSVIKQSSDRRELG